MGEMRKRQVFDGRGNLVSEEAYLVPDDVLVGEQAPVRLRQLLARGRATWTSADLSDIVEALLQLNRV